MKWVSNTGTGTVTLDEKLNGPNCNPRLADVFANLQAAPGSGAPSVYNQSREYSGTQQTHYYNVIVVSQTPIAAGGPGTTFPAATSMAPNTAYINYGVGASGSSTYCWANNGTVTLTEYNPVVGGKMVGTFSGVTSWTPIPASTVCPGTTSGSFSITIQ